MENYASFAPITVEVLILTSKNMKNMKNILTIATLLLIASTGVAQGPSDSKETKEVKIVKKTTESTNAANHQENELRNFRFGLVILPALKWYETESKSIKRDGVVPKFGGGLAIEFRLAKVAAIQTGVNIITSGGKLKYDNGGQLNPGKSTIGYYYNENDEDIQELDEINASKMGGLIHYQVNSRDFKTTYINIPVLLKLKTREIGSMVYFGQFGLNSNFRWKGRATDDVIVLDNTGAAGASDKKSNLVISRDVSFYQAALNFGLGSEWNLAGTTSMVLGLSYNLGFTNVLRKHSRYLEKRQNETGYNPTTAPDLYNVAPLEQVVKENSLVLTVGVLF